MNEILENLAIVNKLKAEVKSLCMIFDVENKQRVAMAKGLPIDTFYYLPFRVWVKVAKRYYRNLDTMAAYVSEFGEFKGKNYDHTPFKEWYHEFGDWAKNNGIRWY